MYPRESQRRPIYNPLTKFNFGFSPFPFLCTVKCHLPSFPDRGLSGFYTPVFNFYSALPSADAAASSPALPTPPLPLAPNTVPSR
mmetsp:Transcript_9857/g.21271  ORF Transcript_9857/g.21271 Transcript_9857/m.21271 type:complete len:85 (+) Transcript_9857:69-323(+)